jgi:hypothetical protein
MAFWNENINSNAMMKIRVGVCIRDWEKQGRIYSLCVWSVWSVRYSCRQGD